MPNPINTYDVGDLVEMSATFTIVETGAPGVPGTVVCTVRAPSGAITTPPVSGTSNPYSAEVTPDEHGTWWYAFDGGPVVQASGENYFVVRLQEVPRITPV